MRYNTITLGKVLRFTLSTLFPNSKTQNGSTASSLEIAPPSHSNHSDEAPTAGTAETALRTEIVEANIGLILFTQNLLKDD